MPISIDAAKFTPPQLYQVLRRRRLNSRICDKNRRCHVIIVGQAAQGKSTLAADALSSERSKVGWIHLDASDTHPATLYHLLVRAVAQADPSLDVAELTDLPDMAFGAGDHMDRCRAGFDALWKRLPTPMTAVLDGLDRIDPESPAMALVAEWVRYPPSHMRCVITTRELPSFHIQRGVVKQSVLILDNEELTFTPDELTDYFHTRHRLDLTPNDLRRLTRVTGGWTGALVLITQALERQPRDRWEDFFARDLPDLFSADTWRFFSEEVFSHQPADVQTFLVESAACDVLEPELLDAVFGRNDSATILADLARRHMFADQLDVEEKSIYRYNRLFRDFLLTRFETFVDETRRRDVYRRVGDAYCRRRQAELAIGYFGKSGDAELLATGLKKIGMDFLARGRFADLGGHFALLPDAAIKADPWLLFFLTVTRRVKGGVRNVADFESALKGFTAAGDGRGQMLALAYLIEAHVFLGSDADTCLTLMGRGEKLLADSSRTPQFTYAKTLLWLHIGLGHIAVGTDVVKGLSAGRNAHLMAVNMGDASLEGTAAIVQALGFTATGEFDRARAALDRVGSRVDTAAFPEYGVFQAIVGMQLSLGRGELEAAGAAIDAITPAIDDFGLLFFYPAVVDATGLLRIYQGRFDSAAASARHLRDLAALSGNSLYRGWAQRLAALNHYHQGNFQDALAPAEDAAAVFTAQGPATLHHMRAQLLLALIYLHTDRIAEGESLAAAAVVFFQETGAHQNVAEALLVRALLAAELGRKAESRKWLTEGLAIAEEKGFHHMTLIRSEDLARSCRLADPRDPWARRWLSDHPMPSSPASPAGTSTVSDVVQRPATPVLHVKTFGAFDVAPAGGASIQEAAWAGNRTRLMLKAIIVHGLREIPKEILIDALWPESRSKAAIRNFKITLHRLRKAIEPGLADRRRSAYIQLRDGRISLTKGLWRVDAADFLQNCKDVKRLLVDGDTQRLVALMAPIIDAYQGDFLPEEPYAPWVEMKRWALREEFLSMMVRLAETLAARQSWRETVDCCRAALRVDGCQEAAARLLMTAYAALGRSGDAIQVYQGLVTILHDELGVGPDAATEATYQHLRNDPNQS